MDRPSRPLALVTGPSSGIGEALARIFAREGYDLVLVARDAARLRSLAADLERAHGTSSLVVPADLANPAAPQLVIRELGGRSVEALVNNAGLGLWGKIADTPFEAELGLFQVNVMSLVALTKLLLPGMVARRRGRILNVASTAAFQPGPLMAGYYASKACVLSYTEALAEELRGTGVTATCLCPGPTKTEFFKRADIEDVGFAQRLSLMDAGDVAEIGYRGMLRGRPVVIPGFMNRMLPFAVRLSPRRIVVKVSRWLQGRSATRP
jgi:short-subunit dehydrogenase